MKDKLSIIAIILACISLLFSAITFAGGARMADSNGQISTQYVVYVGTNDKDAFSPLHTNEEAKNIVDNICLKYFEGYTLQEATGSWTDENSQVTHEYTLVCYFDDADKETVYKAADELLAALNQSTLLIETDHIQVDFYSGK